MGFQFLLIVSPPLMMCWFSHFGMAIKAQRDAIIKIVTTASAFRFNVVQFDFSSTKHMTNAAAATTRNQCLLGNTLRKTHSNPPYFVILAYISISRATQSLSVFTLPQKP